MIPSPGSDDYSVRLVGGCGTSERYSGVVEVLFNGRWGTICGSGWSVEAATVVCRQLGLLTDDTPPSITGVCRYAGLTHLHVHVLHIFPSIQ